jgi:hypothetical protein
MEIVAYKFGCRSDITGVACTKQFNRPLLFLIRIHGRLLATLYAWASANAVSYYATVAESSRRRKRRQRAC